jgi:hypothetical protein
VAGTALMDRIGTAGAGRAVVGLPGGRAGRAGSLLDLVGFAGGVNSANARTLCEAVLAAATVAFGAGDLPAPANVTVAVTPAVRNTAAAADTLTTVDVILGIHGMVP